MTDLAAVPLARKWMCEFHGLTVGTTVHGCLECAAELAKAARPLGGES